MSSYTKPKVVEEDSQSFEGIGEDLDEDGFYGFKEGGYQTWSPFEDLDDSGHFTASPDGDRALSGSSRSHSPCFPSDNTAIASTQMQQHDKHLPQPPQISKPLLAPRSVMTVKVPPPTKTASFLASVIDNGDSNCHDLQNSSSGTFLTESCTNIAPHPVELSSTRFPLSHNSTPDFSPFNSHANSAHGLAEGESAEESTAYLRGILDNFNSLYMEKLKMLDDLVKEGNEEQRVLLMEKKTNMLETWAKDVCVQNMVLVHTVEELEREANRKVASLQTKITESTHAAKEHMIMIKKYEEQVKLLLKNHSDTEDKNLVLKIDLEKLRNECKRVKDRMNLLLKDNESLVTLVCRIRDVGVWDVNGLELHRSSFDQIFGLYPNLVGGEVKTVFTREKAQRIQEADEKVSQLEKQVASLKQTQREAESNMAHKDKKIEELEMEIKNISNKAQYCEQECNDYKRSLLETQEKLLEATRRLNSSSKYTKPNVPGINEMTELIKELRDVKSQLNTAGEEKQTAKDESSKFTRELSQRLKEVHDLQNMFQNLASELVNSRTACQQTKEKEMQLQSLKAEVQAYQSRCANAEDTIRRKDKEIKQLQKQMNEIHKRSKRQRSNPGSSNSIQGTTVTSEHADSTMLRFYESNLRNVSSPSKIPVRKSDEKALRHRSQEPTRKNNAYQTAASNIKQRGASQTDQGRRPLWNTHFKKSEGILSKPPAELPKVSKCSGSNLARSQGSFKKISHGDEADEGIDCLSQECREVYDKLTELGQKLSCDPTLSSNFANQSLTMLESTQAKDSFNSTLFKLPQLKEKVGEETRPSQKQQIFQPSPVTLNENAQNKKKFPVVHKSSPDITKRKQPIRKLENPLFKNASQNQPRYTTPRLNELISAVVETSKQLLGGEDEEPISQNKDIKSVTVTAAHYRKRPKPVKKQPTPDVRRVKSSDKNAEASRAATPVEPTPKMPVKFHSATGISGELKEVPEPTPPEVSYEPPQNVQEFLAGLPQASQEDLVKNWIKTSKSSLHADSNNEKTQKPKKPKNIVVSGRRPSVRVMKHLATRRCPRTQRSKESAEDLNAKMFELEDEWGKVFANIECNLDDGAITGQEKMVKAVDVTKAKKKFPECPTPSAVTPQTCLRDTLATLLTSIITNQNGNNLNDFTCNANSSVGK